MAEHDAAFERFLAEIRTFGVEQWETPRAPGRWSPAEITQHLILTYEVALAEMKGRGDSVTPRVGIVWSTLLRWFLLPHIFFHRMMPRSRAVREIRPQSHPGDPARGVVRMEELAADLRTAFLEHSESLGPLRHPYFGSMSAYQFVRLTAVHLDHHRMQVVECRGGTAA